MILCGAARGVVLAALVWIAVRPVGLAAQTPAPDPHAAQPERPTVATHAGTVATGWVEIEAGTEFDRYADRSHGALAPVLLKLGLAPRLQLSVQVPVVRRAGESTIGLGDLFVGVKWRFMEAAPIAGNVAILPSVKMPTGTSGSGTDTTDVNLLLISSHELGPVSMDLNVGYTRRSGDGTAAPREESLWTAAFGGPARGALGWVAELYGYPSTSGPAGAASIVAILGGPTVQVRKWLVLDSGVIVPITGPQPRALYVGGVYNIGRIWTSRARSADAPGQATPPKLRLQPSALGDIVKRHG